MNFRKGGLDIRKVEDLYSIPGLKLVGRFLTSDSVWADWMNKTYMAKESFWTASSSPMNLGTWKFLISKRKETKMYMRNKIASGLSNYLWFDPGLKEIVYLIHCRIFLFNLIILIGQLASYCKMETGLPQNWLQFGLISLQLQQ